MTSAAKRRLWPLIAAVVVLDQVTKHWALNRLSGGRTIDIVGSLRLNLAFNSGMAFSQATGAGPVIGAVAFVVVIVVVLWMRRSAQSMALVASALIVAGACGNLVDRVFRGDGWLRGAVGDFVDLQWWPVFNLADSAITIGAVLMLISAMRNKTSSHGAEAPATHG